MLPKVSVHRFASAPFTNVESYRRVVGGELIDEIGELARALKGERVCHVNSTGFGGGVAELLSRLQLSTKNMDLSEELCREVIANAGIRHGSEAHRPGVALRSLEGPRWE